MHISIILNYFYCHLIIEFTCTIQKYDKIDFISSLHIIKIIFEKIMAKCIILPSCDEYFFQLF